MKFVRNAWLYVHSPIYVVVVGEQYHEPPTVDLQFPLSADLINFTSSKNISTITIPPSLIVARLKELGDGGT